MRITITIPEDLLHSGTQQISLVAMSPSQARGARATSTAGAEEPRPGSLPDRVIKWARKKAKVLDKHPKATSHQFGTPDIVEQFKVSRAHASMLLSRLANGPYPIVRVRRGIYVFQAPATTEAEK